MIPEKAVESLEAEEEEFCVRTEWSDMVVVHEAGDRVAFEKIEGLLAFIPDPVEYLPMVSSPPPANALLLPMPLPLPRPACACWTRWRWRLKKCVEWATPSSSWVLRFAVLTASMTDAFIELSG